MPDQIEEHKLQIRISKHQNIPESVVRTALAR